MPLVGRCCITRWEAGQGLYAPRFGSENIARLRDYRTVSLAEQELFSTRNSAGDGKGSGWFGVQKGRLLANIEPSAAGATQTCKKAPIGFNQRPRTLIHPLHPLLLASGRKQPNRRFNEVIVFDIVYRRDRNDMAVPPANIVCTPFERNGPLLLARIKRQGYKMQPAGNDDKVAANGQGADSVIGLRRPKGVAFFIPTNEAPIPTTSEYIAVLHEVNERYAFAQGALHPHRTLEVHAHRLMFSNIRRSLP